MYFFSRSMYFKSLFFSLVKQQNRKTSRLSLTKMHMLQKLLVCHSKKNVSNVIYENVYITKLKDILILIKTHMYIATQRKMYVISLTKIYVLQNSEITTQRKKYLILKKSSSCNKFIVYCHFLHVIPYVSIEYTLICFNIERKLRLFLK